MVALIQLPGAPGPPVPGAPSIALPTDAIPAPPGVGGAGGGNMDPLGTVGIALLAYGLVQLLSKVVDKLPVGRGG
ncbi:MAG TPA: hypothetical protein VHG91_01100, partial [Longimicrobium sp.]|nr:hypothetical protein [Longimicrobium sp.]